MNEEMVPGTGIAFALIYFTFFLDNVLLTVLVPIIPDWVRGESLQLWTQRDAPLAAALNHTLNSITQSGHGIRAGGGSTSVSHVGAWQALVGSVLGLKAGAQLATAGAAGGAVSRAGPAAVLRAATILLAFAALVFAWCGRLDSGGAALCCAAGRAAHGAGAALAGVAGLALAAALAPGAVGALLSAVALGVLVGYPFGGVADALHSRSAPFLLIAAALLADLGLQFMFLYKKPEFNQTYEACGTCGSGWGAGWGRAARHGGAAAGAGAVLLTTCVMAALEPCLPLYIQQKFQPESWWSGAVFVPDSAGYAVATLAGSAGAGAGARGGADVRALAGQLAVGLAALAVPHATSVCWLALPQLCLGLGLGGVDAALVPALLRRARHPPHLAALLQAASSAAYAIGPVVGGVLSWCVGFETMMRTLAVLNLLYAAILYRSLRDHPLNESWDSATPDDSSSEGGEGELLRPLPLPPALRSFHQLDQ